MELVVLTKDQWKTFSDDAHKACFGFDGYAALETADYALMIIDHDTPICYTTIKELDSHTCYMQWGGAFEGSLGTVKSFRGYTLMIDYLKQRYPYITTRIENHNIPMLKFAMKVGFKIIGVRNFKESILLEHLMECG
ncbi:MAG: hypothetical protein ACK41T_00685 [Pseudobdellovibrio sp.]